jgi:hypothetical protein
MTRYLRHVKMNMGTEKHSLLFFQECLTIERDIDSISIRRACKYKKLISSIFSRFIVANEHLFFFLFPYSIKRKKNKVIHLLQTIRCLYTYSYKFFIIYFTYIHLNNYLLFLSFLIVLRSIKMIDLYMQANASTTTKMASPKWQRRKYRTSNIKEEILLEKKSTINK